MRLEKRRGEQDADPDKPQSGSRVTQARASIPRASLAVQLGARTDGGGRGAGLRAIRITSIRACCQRG